MIILLIKILILITMDSSAWLGNGSAGWPPPPMGGAAPALVGRRRWSEAESSPQVAPHTILIQEMCRPLLLRLPF